MSHRLPVSTSPLRELFEVSAIADMVVNHNYVSLQESRQDARSTFANAGSLKPSKVHTITLMANDELRLIAWGPKGGHKSLWNFGRHYS